jgi:hypothetical protein
MLFGLIYLLNPFHFIKLNTNNLPIVSTNIYTKKIHVYLQVLALVSYINNTSNAHTNVTLRRARETVVALEKQ